MSAPTWLAPLASALAGLAGGGVGVSWMQRGRTASEAQLNLAEADHKHAEAESLTVQTIQSALETVQRISEGKDEQLARIRAENADQQRKHTEELLSQSQKHAQEMSSLRTQMTHLVEQQSLIARALSAHGQWDMYAAAKLQSLDPSFPDPPPLTFLDRLVIDET